MEDTKAWYRSRTVWGALVAILASLAGIEATAAEQGELAELLVAGVGVAGGIVALLGRLMARRRVR